MTMREAWAQSVALRIVLIFIGGAWAIVTSLVTALVIGAWNLSGDVRENTTLIRTFDQRLTNLERSRGGGME